MSPVVEHPALGRLTWDDAQRLWRGEAEVPPGRRVIVSVDPVGEPLEVALAGAARGVAWLRDHEEEARLCVADHYLETFNRDWSEEGPISREEFARRLELVEVSFGADGAPMLWYEDGGLFAGHDVSAYFDAAGRFRHASLFG
jgi:hypothetical protein